MDCHKIEKAVDVIFFAIIKMTSKGAQYSEHEYKIEDKDGVKWIKGVVCWNGTHDLLFEGTQINVSWVNEFPKGVIESKMWCNEHGLKQAKVVLQKKLDDFLCEKKVK